ncbi:hypothetical protein BGZ89_008488 [Linnemannia elongata]|nr:hypothetical protein BGZ89_008488 [Linnemannia elongata]
MLQGEDVPQESLQAIRSIDKCHPPKSVTPASPDEIFHIEIRVDPKTRKEIVLWEDIVLAFDLEPRRIAAAPNAVLDVVVSTPSANMEGSSRKNLSEGSVSVSVQQDDTAGKDFVIQDVTTTSSVRSNPSHVERPLAFPFARGLRAPLDDLSPDNDSSPAPPHLGNGNNPSSRVLETTTAPETLGEQEELVQTTISAGHGDKDAQVNLGDIYREGNEVPQDYQVAMNWYLKAAEQGDPVGQQRVGAMYSHGFGVPQDYSTAMSWFLKAANQGNAPAQCNVGSLYENGHGVPQNFQQAMNWFRKAADQGHCHGQGVPQDDSQATEWFLRAAKQGLVISQPTIGYCCSNDLGVPQDYAKAAEWYQKATDQGHIEAKTALEDMRKRGRIVD